MKMQMIRQRIVHTSAAIPTSEQKVFASLPLVQSERKHGLERSTRVYIYSLLLQLHEPWLISHNQQDLLPVLPNFVWHSDWQ